MRHNGPHFVKFMHHSLSERVVSIKNSSGSQRFRLFALSASVSASVEASVVEAHSVEAYSGY